MNNLLDQSNSQPTLDENKNYYEELVGEGKKFKDEKELAKGKWIADEYVKTLERSLDEMRNDYKGLRE
jgi:hypothetical protein